MARFVGTARTEVYRQHGLELGFPAPVHELVGAELVGLSRAPREVESRRTLVHGSDSVLPVVAGKEVAAGIAHDGMAEFTRQFQDISTEPLLIGRGVSRLV